MLHFIFRLAVGLSTFLLGVSLAPINRVAHRQTYVIQHVKQVRRHQLNIQVMPVTQECEFCFYDVAILDNGEMWAVGYDTHDTRQMWHSKNNGQTWETISAPTEGWLLSSIQFIDRKHGWATGSGNVLIRTSDGGTSWETLRLPIYMDYSKVRFVNSQVGYVAGSIGYKDRKTGYIVPGVEILRTMDGGKTWRVCYKDNKSGNVWGIAVLSENIAVISVDGQSLLRTEDGGRKWEIVATHKRAGFQDIIFKSDGNGWAVGERSFYHSTDKGKTWRNPDNFPASLLNHDWSAIDFADDNLGVAVSEDCAIAITYDGGNTWQAIKTNLHEGDVIKTKVFDERLRGIRLRANTGVIFGSQRLYRIESFE